LDHKVQQEIPTKDPKDLVVMQTQDHKGIKETPTKET
jgi:hypothetical protein